MASYKAVMEGKYKVRENYLDCDSLIENGMFLCGSAETVAAKLEEYQKEMGFRKHRTHAAIWHASKRADREKPAPIC